MPSSLFAVIERHCGYPNLVPLFHGCPITFSATSIGQSEFIVEDPREHGGRKDPASYQGVIENKFLNDLAWEINEQSAKQCREWCDRIATQTGRPRSGMGFVSWLDRMTSSFLWSILCPRRRSTKLRHNKRPSLFSYDARH